MGLFARAGVVRGLHVERGQAGCIRRGGAAVGADLVPEIVVRRGIKGGDPLGRVRMEEAAEEVLGLGGQPAKLLTPQGRGESRAAGRNSARWPELRVLWEFRSALPAVCANEVPDPLHLDGVGFGLWHVHRPQGRVAEEVGHRDAAGPHVDRARVVGFAEEHLWRSEGQRLHPVAAGEALVVHASGQLAQRLSLLGALELLADAKIGNLCNVVALDQNIGGLDVPVKDPMPVHHVDSTEQLVHITLHVRRRELKVWQRLEPVEVRHGVLEAEEHLAKRALLPAGLVVRDHPQKLHNVLVIEHLQQPDLAQRHQGKPLLLGDGVAVGLDALERNHFASKRVGCELHVTKRALADFPNDLEFAQVAAAWASAPQLARRRRLVVLCRTSCCMRGCSGTGISCRG
mmetsp:Transcript_14679/g.55297  ORF Transcript_14679/g.55297 Transcript_14679/m.55297 type:complete len:401 (+) Transcript_14679:957-2159(+)